MITSSKETILENWVTLESSDGTLTGMFCAEFPVHSSEFYKAQQQGIAVEKALLVNSDEYDYQERAEYEGVNYAVYRSYPRSDGYTELYLNQNAGSGY